MGDETSNTQYLTDVNTRIRDIEEKQRLMKERVLLLGNTFIGERDKTFKDVQDMKKELSKVKEDNKRIKELLQRITEQLEGLARKEELMILQRQFDLLRG